MSNGTVTNQVTTSSDSVTNTVTKTLINTHCILCNSSFTNPRAGKLYCSSRCKKYRFNHRLELTQQLDGINLLKSSTKTVFNIEEFIRYYEIQKHLKKYKELKRKIDSWEAVNQEIALMKHYGVFPTNTQWEQLIRGKISNAEDLEFTEADSKLDNEVISLDLKEFIRRLVFYNPGLPSHIFLIISAFCT
jgi:hypothetical protein